MNRTEHLLSILAEECAEVAQRATKAQRFGLSEIQPGQELTNAERIMQEVHDLYGIVEMLQYEGGLPGEYDNAAVMAKIAKVEHYLKFSAECGTLQSTGDKHA